MKSDYPGAVPAPVCLSCKFLAQLACHSLVELCILQCSISRMLTCWIGHGQALELTRHNSSCFECFWTVYVSSECLLHESTLPSWVATIVYSLLLWLTRLLAASRCNNGQPWGIAKMAGKGLTGIKPINSYSGLCNSSCMLVVDHI